MEVSLRVYEAYPKDVGRFVIRLHKKMLKSLGITPGDIIEIRGRRRSAGIAHPLSQEEAKDNIVRIDGIMRKNLRVGIGDNVIIKKIDEQTAKTIILAPLYKLSEGEVSPEYVKEKLLNYPVCGGDILLIQLGINREVKFKVSSTTPSDIVVVRTGTKLIISNEIPDETGKIPYITYEDIGGFKKSIRKIREMIELPLKYPSLFSKLGVEPPKGVLIHGPPGSGKTLLAQAVANESNAHFISINGPEIMSKYYGESEKRLREIFTEAERNAPSIIFIDELDAIAPRREDTIGEVERRVVAQLLTLMDGIKSRGSIIVIGATNRVNAIDPALRRPGRFDREIELGVPDYDERLEILQIHTRGMPLDKSVNLSKLAELTYGFVGADLAALCREAGMRVMQRMLSNMELDEDFLSSKIVDQITITEHDFIEALREITPSALREICIEKPQTKWSNIGGLETVKKKLLEAVTLSLSKSYTFKEIGLTPYNGILVYGPPGCGKTVLIRGLANEVNANYIEVKGAELFSKWVGETEKAIGEIFRKAKSVSPCIVFFDEIDTVGSIRVAGSSPADKIVNRLIAEIDNIASHQKIIVIGATNRPDSLDPALIRSGRFDLVISIPPPDFKERLEILKICTAKINMDRKVNLEEIAKITEDYVGADLHALCREAAIISLREEKNEKTVRREHFEEALKTVHPSLSKDMIEWYKTFEKKFSKVISDYKTHIV